MSPQMVQRITHWGRVAVLVSAVGNIGSVLFFAAGFGFITPQRTLAQLNAADVSMHASISDLQDTVAAHEEIRAIDRVEELRMIHATLVIECLTAKPSVLARVNVACAAVLAEGAIR